MLSSYAATTRGEATTCQKRAHPMPAVLRTSVESGINAIRLR